MIDKKDLQKLGILAKPHGVAGEISLRMEVQWAGYEPDPEYLFVEVNGGLVPFEVASLRIKNDINLLVGLDMVISEEKARLLKGANVYINPEELGDAPEVENISLNAFVGFEVTDTNHGLLGIVQSVAEIHNNPLLELLFNEKEVLIPFNEDLIVSMDAKNRKMLISAPPGLIDLYLE
jgi:16S rRNA processing protein RimM